MRGGYWRPVVDRPAAAIAAGSACQAGRSQLERSIRAAVPLRIVAQDTRTLPAGTGVRLPGGAI